MSKNRSNFDISNFRKSFFWLWCYYYLDEDEEDEKNQENNEIDSVEAAFTNFINNEFQICFEEHEDLWNVLRGNCWEPAELVLKCEEMVTYKFTINSYLISIFVLFSRNLKWPWKDTEILCDLCPSWEIYSRGRKYKNFLQK